MFPSEKGYFSYNRRSSSFFLIRFFRFKVTYSVFIAWMLLLRKYKEYLRYDYIISYEKSCGQSNLRIKATDDIIHIAIDIHFLLSCLFLSVIPSVSVFFFFLSLSFLNIVGGI